MNIAKRMKVLIKLFQKFAGDWGERPQGLNRRSREEKARAVVLPGRRPVNKGPDGFHPASRKERRKPAAPWPMRCAPCGLRCYTLFPQSYALLSVVGRCPTPRSL